MVGVFVAGEVGIPPRLADRRVSPLHGSSDGLSDCDDQESDRLLIESQAIISNAPASQVRSSVGISSISKGARSIALAINLKLHDIVSGCIALGAG